MIVTLVEFKNEKQNLYDKKNEAKQKLLILFFYFFN
jgi:hypothetical protein